MIAMKNETPFNIELTNREKEVLKLSKDYSSREIADRLSISIHTVRTHEARLRSKFGVHSKLGLIRVAEKAGVFNEDAMNFSGSARPTK